ncbi:MAG: sigma-70 family RNA polymerase sigma factor [Fulvivirga sp.]
MLNVSYSNNSSTQFPESWECESDLELWQAFTQGDEKAFAYIYEHFAAELYSYGMKVRSNSNLVQDCIHDLFVDLWRKKDNLKPTDNIKFYLFRALRRRIADAIKRDKKIYADSAHSLDDVIITLPFESVMINRQLEEDRNKKIIHVLSKLSQRQKEAIDLIFYQEMSYQEVSEIMDINVRSLYTLTWKAVSSMRKHLLEMLTLPLVCILF